MPRKRKPTALKLVDGETRTERLNDQEPDYGVATPEPPAWLRLKAAKDKWAELYPVFDAAGVFQYTDADALAHYCRLYAVSIRSKDTRELIAISKEMRMYWAEFGMTPSSRSRIIAPKRQQEQDAMEKLLAQRRAREARQRG